MKPFTSLIGLMLALVATGIFLIPAKISLAEFTFSSACGLVQVQDKDDPDNSSKDEKDETDAEQSESDAAESDEQETADKDEEAANEDSADIGELKRNIRSMNRLRSRSRLGESVIQLLDPIAADVSPHTVRIWSGKDQIALGIIVDAQGLILTAHSELKNPLECQLADGRRFPARVNGIHAKTDLALLKIDASGLSPASFPKTANLDRGTWLVSVSPDKQPVSFGVVGVPAREITSVTAFVGILMNDVEKGVQILSVTEKSPAQSAGLLPDDVITKMDEYPTPNMNKFRELLAEHYDVGDRVELTVLREEKEIVIGLELADREKFTNDSERINEQDRMGSKLSRRRSKFSLAIQHDSNLNANQMGSPIVDLDGNIVGINISRSGRVSTYALPISEVLPALAELLTGNLSPTIINQKRIAEIASTLPKLVTQLEPLGTKLSESELKLAAEQARREELERINKDIDQRLADVSGEAAELEKSTLEMEQQLKDLHREVENLKNEKRLLETGAR